jgi:hypothetical protein
MVGKTTLPFTVLYISFSFRFRFLHRVRNRWDKTNKIGYTITIGSGFSHPTFIPSLYAKGPQSKYVEMLLYT